MSRPVGPRTARDVPSVRRSVRSDGHQPACCSSSSCSAAPRIQLDTARRRLRRVPIPGWSSQRESRRQGDSATAEDRYEDRAGSSHTRCNAARQGRSGCCDRAYRNLCSALVPGRLLGCGYRHHIRCTPSLSTLPRTGTGAPTLDRHTGSPGAARARPLHRHRAQRDGSTGRSAPPPTHERDGLRIVRPAGSRGRQRHRRRRRRRTR
ncbi:MAG: hypothetical protein M3445_08510 [Actinomycetota bacterium]|nr:hypothetical protein [Actinomycetota bacterium]